MTSARVVLALAVAAVGACAPREETPGAGGRAAAPGPFAEAEKLIEQGKLDEASARLEKAGSSPEARYLLGVVWARKSETTPVPTPYPEAPGSKDAPPQRPEFKQEELKAVELLDGVAAPAPVRARAQLALANLLGPHAVRRHEAEVAEKDNKKGRGKPMPSPPPDPVDFSPERVAAAYKAAAEHGAVAPEALDALIRFSGLVGRHVDAKAAFESLAARDRQDIAVLERYGEYLLTQAQEPDAAIAPLSQILFLQPDHEGAKAKLARIHFEKGRDAYTKGQYGMAEAHFHDAEKFVTGSSPVAGELRDYKARLASIRR